MLIVYKCIWLGWPSFYDVASQGKVSKITDTSFGMVRVEVVCSNVSTDQSFVLIYCHFITTPVWCSPGPCI